MKTNVNIIEVVGENGATVVARRKFLDPQSAVDYVTNFNRHSNPSRNRHFYTFAEISN